MKSTARSCLGLVVLSSFSLFVACGDDDDDAGGGKGAAAGESSEAGATSQAGKGGSGGSTSHAEGGAGGAAHGEGALVCEVLGELCHAADTGSGPAHDCHNVGHVGAADACEAEFAGCVETCTGTDLEAPGADAKCAAIGSLCHAAGEVDDDAKECHELGHLGNAADCADSFDSCATLCLAVLETIEHGSEGGAHAGGAHAGGAHAGGAHAGGAGGAP